MNCIYIDPPYNTGNENWVYNDNVNSPLMQQWLQQNGPVDGEDLERHDKWLCMMWPRLQLLKELLAEDGVIFVSIDDNELHNLVWLIRELFGDDAYLATVTWKKRGGPPNDRKIGRVHEYVLLAGEESSISLRPRSDDDSTFTNPDRDPRGPWRLQQLHANTKGGRWVDSLYYGITNPSTGVEHFPPSNRNWVHSRESAEKMIATGDIIFGLDGLGPPKRKRFQRDARQGLTWPTVWETDKHESFPTNRDATIELKLVFGEVVNFDTPKPSRLIERILRMAAGPDSIVLDSFAGSGTTAHAVLSLNRQDGGNRRFILVECEDYADSITAERVRRVISGVPAAKDQALREGLGGSFTYCTLGEPFDAESLLKGEALPDFETLACYLLHTAAGVSIDRAALRTARNDGRFYQTETADYYLYYEADVEWLGSQEAMLTEQRVQQIAARNEAEGRQAVVFGAGKYVSQRELTERRITFCQLPYELYRTG